MKYVGEVKDTMQRIVDSFKNGDLPEKIAQTFITTATKKHCETYSFMNRLIVALNGYSDARGFKQWKKIGRYVLQGQKGFAILAPIMINKRNTEDNGTVTEKKICIGFKAIKVFGLDQSGGKPIEQDKHVHAFLNTLPLLNVDVKWNIEMQAYNGDQNGAYGFYSLNGKKIALGTQNLSTWAHELSHAADDRLGTLKADQIWIAEISAELAGAALLESIGYKNESDRGGEWEYINHYATQGKIETIDACRMVIGRVGKIVELIIAMANEEGNQNQ